MSNHEDEVERRLAELRGVSGAAAALVEALEADAPFPDGARGARLLARAKAAVGAAAPSLATIVVQWVDGILELVGGDGRLGEVVRPVAVRGEASGAPLLDGRGSDQAPLLDGRSSAGGPLLGGRGSGGGLLVRHRLGDREVATHVDARGPARFAVLLDFGSDAATRGTRVSLRSMARGGREILSETLRQGRFLLPELGVGDWRVEIRDAAGWVGELDLVLGERAA